MMIISSFHEFMQLIIFPRACWNDSDAFCKDLDFICIRSERSERNLSWIPHAPVRPVWFTQRIRPCENDVTDGLFMLPSNKLAWLATLQQKKEIGVINVNGRLSWKPHQLARKFGRTWTGGITIRSDLMTAGPNVVDNNHSFGNV